MPYVTVKGRRARERIHALSGIQSRPRKAVYIPALSGMTSSPKRPQDIHGTLAGRHSLGDDATQTQILGMLQQQRDLQAQFNAEDKKLRLIQIATTAAIPLFAAAWRFILGWRAGRIQIL